MALVVELPPAGLIRHRGPGLEADTMAAADLGERGGAATGDERLAGLGVLLRVVELRVPVDADDHRRLGWAFLRRERGERVLLHVLPVVRDESTQPRILGIVVDWAVAHRRLLASRGRTSPGRPLCFLTTGDPLSRSGARQGSISVTGCGSEWSHVSAPTPWPT